MLPGLSFTEIAIILVLALLLLGPDELPKIARALGKGLREVRKATDDLKSTFEQEMASVDVEPRLLQPAPRPPISGPPDDPAAARAAARRAAAQPPPAETPLRLVAPEGVVARDAARPAEPQSAAPADTGARAAPAAGAPAPTEQKA